MAYNGDGDPSHTGRMILTVLYLSMLGVCFVVPFFFYMRMHCDHRNNRRLRELEIAGMEQAMNESQDVHREESRAALRKYREERRARILQLFIPVRLILTEDNFLRSEVVDAVQTVGGSNNENEESVKSEEDQDHVEGGPDTIDPNVKSPQEIHGESDCAETGGCYSKNNDDDDDEEGFILIPRPGLPDGASIYEFNTNMNLNIESNNKTSQRQYDKSEMRQAPNECSICLCEYKVGSDVVWSSNSKCDHVFHKSCIEEWLMKQRDGPLCPCCRRDFVIDPFDCGVGEINDLEKGFAPAVIGSDSLGVPLGANNTRTIEIPSIGDSVDSAMVGMILAASLAGRMDSSDGSSSSLHTHDV